MEKNIKHIQDYVKKNLKNDKSGHDYKHTRRVLKTSLKIAKDYPEIDKDVLIISCLLHDIAFKDGFVKDHHLVGAKQAKKFLADLSLTKTKIKKIITAIEDHQGNFSKPVRPKNQLQIESKILRDADNIDALGKIGLQRMLDFSKSQKFPIFKNKNKISKDGLNESLYGNLNFLLTWPDKMLTHKGKRIGKKSLKPIRDYIKKLEEERKCQKILNQTNL